MPQNFNQLASKTTLYGVLEALKSNINYNLNCIKVATVEQFFADNLTVSCKINNKRVVGLKEDGNQILKDYPLIYAKVHYFGWGDVGATYPIKQGMEGVLLFNDRELETWFLTGQGGNLAYDRCHSLSDAIFICGVHSIPNMINLVADCLNIFYKNTYIQLLETGININGNIAQAGNVTSTGTVTGASLVDTSGATGTFKSSDSPQKTITVQNGIIKSIS